MSDTAVLEHPTEEAGAVVPVKAKPPKPRDLTVEEEQKLSTYYAMCEKGQRLLLLAAFEGSAHKAYNKQTAKGGTKVANFEEYCRDRLGVTGDASYLSRQLSAARVERALQGESFNVLKLAAAPEEAESAAFRPKLTFRAAEAISKLPEEEWQKVYEEATQIPGETTPLELSSNIQRIAGRRDRELHPDKPKPGRKAGEPAPRRTAAPDGPVSTAGVEGVPQKRDMTPVRGETYDGSPEQQFIENGGTAEEWKALQAAAQDQDDAAEAPGGAEGVSEGMSALEVAQEENITLRSFLKAFIAAMELPASEQPELHLMTLYNDATEWAKGHGL